MLSRTAGELFWLGRYIERADNVSRFVQAGQRFDAMAGGTTHSNEWSAILIASGCSETFGGKLLHAKAEEAIYHLVLDPANPSSILSSFQYARANARSQRGAITTDTWLAANESWAQIQRMRPKDLSDSNLMGTLEKIRGFAAQFRGAVSSTMLRDERLSFIELGRFVERADATARLLDVKYHVLLPDAESVGQAADKLQWHNLLHAAGARAAYRWVYPEAVDHRLVIDFLLLNRKTPRSYSFALEQSLYELEVLHARGSERQESLMEAHDIHSALQKTDVAKIIDFGLHEYLTSLIIRSNALASKIASDFGFGPTQESMAQSQDQ